jgi:hypothetical protein
LAAVTARFLREVCAGARVAFAAVATGAPCSIGNIAPALAVTDEQRGCRAATLLLQRMLDVGVSRWHPNPARECDRVEG